MNAACCDDPEESCTSGVPTTCGRGCAAVLLPMQRVCADFLVSARLRSSWSMDPWYGPENSLLEYILSNDADD